MSIRKVILIVWYIHSVKSDEYFSYNFEKFNDHVGVCASVLRSWEERSYSLVQIDPPNQFSTMYISPRTTLSCVSSFIFPVTAQGVMEFHVYMSGSPTDSLWILASQYVVGGNDYSIGNIMLQPGSANFVPGWSTHRMTLLGSGTFQAYVSFMGMAAADSIVLIDSFRYIPPCVMNVKNIFGFK